MAETVLDAGCSINKLVPLSLLYKKNGELLFALCEADVTDPQGNKLPRYIFIRGHAVIVVPLVKNRDTGEERFLMIRQRRIGNGGNNLEFPAGMLDREVNAARAVAVRELSEETGLDVERQGTFFRFTTARCTAPLVQQMRAFTTSDALFRLPMRNSPRLRDGARAAQTTANP